MMLTVGNKDLSEIVEKITWSGDTRQVARKLSFSIASKATDHYLPKPKLSEGDSVLLKDDAGKVVFGGILFDIDKSGGSNTTTYLAFDLMFYINQSQLSRVFDDTPENITSAVCSELGVPFGGAAHTGIKVYMPCFGKTGYEVIMMGYTAASRQNSKKYMPLMKNVNQLWVIEKGAYSGAVLEGGYNLTDSNYKTSLQKLVNKVLITDKTGKIVDKIEDTASMKKYGVVQKIYQKEDGKDAKTEAKALMEGIEQAGSVSGISDVRAISGYSIAVQEPVSGLYGLFYIESDTHTFENGKATMQLTLAFQNMMDEKEIEKQSSKEG